MGTLLGFHLIRAIVAFVLVGAGPFLDIKVLRRLREAPDGKLRLRYYRHGVAGLWVAGIICFGLIGFHGLVHLPAQVIETHHGITRMLPKPILLGIAAGLSIGLVAPGILSLLSARMQMAYEKVYARDSVVSLLPVGEQQRRWWFALSLTAGICEEVIFRGFLLTVLRIDLHQTMLLALVASSIAFGWAHLYQGIAGILKTSILGLLFALLAFATGGLIVPMVLHFIIDVQVLAVYRPHVEHMFEPAESSSERA